MAFGKQIVYQTFHSAGTNNNRYFAEDINDFIMAMQGNYIISGCGATVGATTDLTSAGTHVVIAAGSAFVNGAVRTIGATNVDLSTAFNALAAGQSRLILIYITSAGAVATISGDITTDGNQLPEASSTGWTPADSTPLAWIYLTAADTVMSSNQIYNDLIYAPNGAYFNGDVYLPDNKKSYWGTGSDLYAYHDGTNSLLYNATGYLQIQSVLGNIHLRTGDSILITDDDDSGASLWQFNTSVGSRAMKVGTASDPVDTTLTGKLVATGVAAGSYIAQFEGGGGRNLYFGLSDGATGYGSVLTANDIFIAKSWSNSANGSLVFLAGGGLSTDGIEFWTGGTGAETQAFFIARTGLLYNRKDSSGYYTGASDDLRMYHDGTDSIINNITGDLNLAINSSTIVNIDSAGVSVNGVLNIDAGGNYRLAAGGAGTYRIDVENSSTASIGKGIAYQWATYSSIRWKDNIDTIENPFDYLDRIRGVWYDTIPQNETDESERTVGFIAEEFHESGLECIVDWEIGGEYYNESEKLPYAEGLAYERLTPILVEASKYLNNKITVLQQTVEKLVDEIKILKGNKK